MQGRRVSLHANNKIPIGSNSAANYLLANPSLYPLPNQAPQAGSPATNNYRGVQKLRNYGDQFDTKVDWKATEKDNLSVRYTGHSARPLSTRCQPVSLAPPPSRYGGLAINAVHTFNATMVNEFRAGYNRIQNNGAVLLDPTGVSYSTATRPLASARTSPTQRRRRSPVFQP